LLLEYIVLLNIKSTNVEWKKWEKNMMRIKDVRRGRNRDGMGAVVLHKIYCKKRWVQVNNSFHCWVDATTHFARISTPPNLWHYYRNNPIRGYTGVNTWYPFQIQGVPHQIRPRQCLNYALGDKSENLRRMNHFERFTKANRIFFFIKC